MSIPIEKGIPMPGARSGRTATYPFDQMEPGDSFAFKKEVVMSVRRQASHKARGTGKKFTVSVVECRCWRVS